MYTSTGQLDPSKVPLLKTAEMKSHIGKLCDNMDQTSEAEKSSKASKTECSMKTESRLRSSIREEVIRYAIKPAALPITIVKEVKVQSRGKDIPAAKSRSGINNNYNNSSSKKTAGESHKVKPMQSNTMTLQAEM